MPRGALQAALLGMYEQPYWMRKDDRMPKFTTHWKSEIIRPRMCFGVTSLCHSGTIMAQQPLAMPLMMRPAMRQATLLLAVVMAMPIVNSAEPQSSVFLRPSLSARKSPVRRLPTNAPAWIEAVMPP